MALLNKFMVGADPEFLTVRETGVRRHPTPNRHSLYGFDHNGYVVEPHPVPSLYVRDVVKSIKAGLETYGAVHDRSGGTKWRAGGYFNSPERRFYLGGHVHIDLKAPTPEQLAAMDRYTWVLESLDILPTQECEQRRHSFEYGQPGSIRQEHGHFEYRTMPSWLFSTKTSMLCITGIKMACVDPSSFGTLPKNASYKDLQKLFELYKGKDDDVDWILNRDYFSSDMEAHPDRDIKTVWKVEPKMHPETDPRFVAADQATRNLFQQEMEMRLRARQELVDAGVLNYD